MSRPNAKSSPGTVSRILWHFTGGPRWVEALKRQSSKRKSSKEAFRNLAAILKTRELRVGSYREVVNVVLAEKPVRDSKTHKTKVLKNVPVTMYSVPVCCVSDIPAPHLRYHAERYGLFALGFHRKSIVRAGFNPVFYTLSKKPIVRALYKGLSAARAADWGYLRELLFDAQTDFDTLTEFATESDSDVPLFADLDAIDSEVTDLEGSVTSALNGFSSFIAFTKTFDESEFESIYCEREWRSTRAFKFRWSDVAMIVVPRRSAGISWFKRFLSEVVPSAGIPRSIPIVPWEDLIEH